ncbi:MAG: hypothetical protein ACREBR_03405 [bacterium]
MSVSPEELAIVYARSRDRSLINDPKNILKFNGVGPPSYYFHGMNFKRDVRGLLSLTKSHLYQEKFGQLQRELMKVRNLIDDGRTW